MLKRFETFIANCQLNDQRSIFVDQLFSEKKKTWKRKDETALLVLFKNLNRQFMIKHNKKKKGEYVKHLTGKF